MASYNIIAEKKALGKLSVRTQTRVVQAINYLSDEPRPDGCKKLKGKRSIYRIRVGKYRVLYEVKDNKLLILVVSIDHRSVIHKKH